MSRRKSELSHVVYSGWMIKSPPEKKLMGPWKIFRAKWKRRYFVLSKPAQSLPGTYHLNYYSDENCRRLRGSIDLEQCAEIVESLDSDQFKFLLAIKTTHRGRDRTYFLATDTEEQMTTWVRNLCTVCGMRPDEVAEEPDGSPQPPRREELPVNRRVQNTQPSQPVNPEIMSKPPSMLSSSVPSNVPVHSRSRITGATSPPKAAVREVDSEYIPLETCSSGTSIRRTARQDSVPDEEAPPPPILLTKHSKGDDSESDVFGGNNVYDVPPSLKEGDDEDDNQADDIYKVPPSRSQQSALDAYDILPPTHHSPSSPRSSSSEKVDSAYSSGQMYDVPPTRTDGPIQDEIYDIPPSHCGPVMSLPENISLDVVPPVRPPKPGSLHGQPLQTSQDSYMNLPMNSKVYTKSKVGMNSVVQSGASDKKHVVADLYDIPPSAGVDRTLSNQVNDSLSITPPPPHIFGREHKYINAHGGVVPDQDMYLPMDPVGKDPDLPLGRKSSSTDNEVEYTDMSGRSSFDDSFEGKSIYDHPPPTSSRAPPRPARSTAVPDLLPQDTYSIFSTSRTRSFKKKTEGSPLAKHKTGPVDVHVQKSKTVPLQNTVQLPVKPDLHPDFSTSDEDDDDMESPNVWETTPPAPTNKDNDIKYVELDHDNEDTTEKEPLRSPHATEYHEIDFVKTDALRNVKETVNVERSKEKNNNS